MSCVAAHVASESVFFRRHYYLTPDRAPSHLRHRLGQTLLEEVRKDELCYRFLYGTKRIKTFLCLWPSYSAKFVFESEIFIAIDINTLGQESSIMHHNSSPAIVKLGHRANKR